MADEDHVIKVQGPDHVDDIRRVAVRWWKTVRAPLDGTGAGTEPARRAPVPARLAGEPLAQVPQRRAQQPGSVHLGNAEALAGLGLGEVPAEPQGQDRLLAFRELTEVGVNRLDGGGVP